MQQVKPLSPKKYIETKARSLPIYKCIVNKNWNEGRIADVIVMRKHTSGNITAGVYLVDLLCLGVKETFFFFNESEDKIMKALTFDDVSLETIDYATAHNIVYAGHDFAMDYHIHPHKDFAITKYILEEDNDIIPLIEISVGDEEGKPHLFLHTPRQHSDVLAKLKKYAGKGNYHYTLNVGVEKNDGSVTNEEDGEDGDDEYYSQFINDYKTDNITPWAARHILSPELNNKEKVVNRTVTEQLTLLIESFIRLLGVKYPDFSVNVETTPEHEYNKKAFSHYDNVLQNEYFQSIEEMVSVLEDEDSDDADENNNNKSSGLYLNLLEKYAHNPLIVSGIYERSFLDKREASLSFAKTCLLNLSLTYPPAILSIALCSLFNNEADKQYDFIYNNTEMQSLFPETTQWHLYSLGTFWLIQTVIFSRKEDLKNAVLYYDLFAHSRSFSFMLVKVQLELSAFITKNLELDNATFNNI